MLPLVFNIAMYDFCVKLYIAMYIFVYYFCNMVLVSVLRYYCESVFGLVSSIPSQQGVHHLAEAAVGLGDFATAVDADEAARHFVVVEHGAGLVLVFL